MEISDEDLSILRAFALKIKSCMPTQMYSMLAHAFPKEPPPSLAHACARVLALSGVKPTLFDCCVNSCCCYIGPYINDQNCTMTLHSDSPQTALHLFDDERLLHGLSSYITTTSCLIFVSIANISSALAWFLVPKNLKTSTHFCGLLSRSS